MSRDVPTPLLPDTERNVSVVVATRDHLIHPEMLRLYDCKPAAMDWILADTDKGGVSVCVLVNEEPVGAAIIVAADRSLNVLIHEQCRRAGLGQLAAKTALGLAFDRGMPDIVARVQPSSDGERLAKKLQFVVTGQSTTEVFLRITRGTWSGSGDRD